jgi:hypothetical protein
MKFDEKHFFLNPPLFFISMVTAAKFVQPIAIVLMADVAMETAKMLKR